MEAVDAIDSLAQVFKVAAGIALGVLGVYLGDVVEWLVDVTCVVDHESQGE